MYRRDSKGWLKHFDFMVLDLLVLQIAFVLSYVLHHDWKNPFDEPLYTNMSIFLMLCDLLIIFFTEPFRNILKRGYYKEFEVLLQQTLLTSLVRSRSRARMYSGCVSISALLSVTSA
mgnify:CR=1 FL=1